MACAGPETTVVPATCGTSGHVARQESMQITAPTRPKKSAPPPKRPRRPREREEVEGDPGADAATDDEHAVMQPHGSVNVGRGCC